MFVISVLSHFDISVGAEIMALPVVITGAVMGATDCSVGTGNVRPVFKRLGRSKVEKPVIGDGCCVVGCSCFAGMGAGWFFVGDSVVVLVIVGAEVCNFILR